MSTALCSTKIVIVGALRMGSSCFQGLKAAVEKDEVIVVKECEKWLYS